MYLRCGCVHLANQGTCTLGTSELPMKVIVLCTLLYIEATSLLILKVKDTLVNHHVYPYRNCSIERCVHVS